jgi:hypothetical protein
MVVEGYFNESIGHETDLIEGAEITNVQVAIFSSQRQRQFIVCYRGSMAQHAKPVKNKPVQDSSCVNSSFGDAYYESNLEDRVLTILNRLMGDNPFFDVIYTGHSFGGCLSQIGAVRCAKKYPMMTISCHVFGVPKVGSNRFKERAHSLPNLKIIRVEYGVDNCIELPHGSSWHHIGHAIVITPTASSRNKRRSASSKEGNNRSPLFSPAKENRPPNASPQTVALAYKFGKNVVVHPTYPMTRMRNVIETRPKKTQGKSDHEMRSYLNAIEHCTHFPTQFCGDDGRGILIGDSKEPRMVV